MNIYKINFTSLQLEILRLLCIKAGTILNQREIARLLTVSAAAIGQALPALEKEELIIRKKNKTLHINTVELNRDNQKTKHFKRTENLRLLSEAGLLEKLQKTFPGSVAVLMGSYSLGEDTINSDIDIAIVGQKEEHVNLTAYEKLLERPISLHFFEKLESVPKNFRTNINNGIPLTGLLS